MRKVWAIALPMVCFIFASCSRLKRPELLDVTGCEEIKWGMTLTQAKDILGSRATLTTDPKNGKTLETVKMVIGDVELRGFVSTKPESDRINGVHFISRIKDVKQNTFKRLKSILTEKYGTPKEVLAGKICFWGFASGNVVLTAAEGELFGLSYVENEFDPRTVLQD